MIHELPILRSLDPHHQRLGYLGVLSAVAVRALDHYDALAARMRDVLFERFYPDEPRFASAMERVEPSIRKKLDKLMRGARDDNPAAILQGPDAGSWLTRSQFWLHETCMPSHVGYLQHKHVGRTIDLARWTGVLLPTLELSEVGSLLKLLVSGPEERPNLSVNLMHVGARLAARLLYVRLLLAAETAFPSLVVEFADRAGSGRPLSMYGDQGLLRASVARFLEAVGEPTDPEDVLTFRQVVEFREAFESNASTEENYLRPRLEVLVDLEILGRSASMGEERAGAFPWVATSVTVQLAKSWSQIASHPKNIDTFLDEQFVGSTLPALGFAARPHANDEEVLLWFARAFRLAQREFGFTPGRTVSILASLLAAEAGVVIEVQKFFDAVYQAPAGPYASYFQFSGGSRFDREFMIRVAQELLPMLEKAAHPSHSTGKEHL